MTVVAIVTDELSWDQNGNTEVSDKLRETLETAMFACPPEPTDPMDTAVHAFAESQIGPVKTRFANTKLIRAYGLRPDLFAVANIMSNVDDTNGMAYAKGSLEVITELCQLSENRLANIRKQVDTLALDGVRVLAVAKTSVNNVLQEQNLPESPRGLNFNYLGD